MNLLLDTNVVLIMTRAKDRSGMIKFINPDNMKIYLSIASEAELKSITTRNNWGTIRLDSLNAFLEGVTTMEINQLYLNIYAEIDTYSQRSNPSFENYPFTTPRNMGKNDLWIASLAALLNLQLVTTDADFDHLHNVFFEVRKIVPPDFNRFF